jgi:hypothetical protein
MCVFKFNVQQNLTISSREKKRKGKKKREVSKEVEHQIKEETLLGLGSLRGGRRMETGGGGGGNVKRGRRKEG